MKKQASSELPEPMEVWESSEVFKTSDPTTPADLSEAPEPANLDYFSDPADLNDFLDHISQADLENVREEQIEQTLTGEWEFVGYCFRHNVNSPWQAGTPGLVKPFRWTFHPEGLVREQCENREPEWFHYSLYPEDRELFILRDERFETSLDEDFFIIQALTPPILWLYDQHADDNHGDCIESIILWRPGTDAEE